MSGYRWFIRFWLIDCDRVGRDPHSILPGGEWHDGAGGGRIPQLTLGRLLTHLTTETGLRAGFPLNSWENPERLQVGLQYGATVESTGGQTALYKRHSFSSHHNH